MKRALSLLLLLAPAFALAAPKVAPKPVEATPLVSAPLEDWAAVARALREHYTKFEYRIAMRDGVKLYTVAYVPKHEGSYPVLMTRTPYSVSSYGVDGYPAPANERAARNVAPGPEFVRAGYIFVEQDVRGRMMSEGSFVDVRPRLPEQHGPRDPRDIDESTDTWDSIEFLVHHLPRNNGNVGLWGISYPGFYTTMGGIDAHPACKAISPQAPVTDWFGGDDFHHNGAFFLADAYAFYADFGRARAEPTRDHVPLPPLDSGDLYDFFLRMGPLANADARHLHGKIGFWNDLMAHGTLDDFWRARDPRPGLRKVRPAVMTVGGWFDAEDLFGTLGTYRAIERQNAGLENVLVMGPWGHGGWHRSEGETLADMAFGARTSRWFRSEIELPFFERQLRGRTPPRAAEATIFETGTNEWHSYDAWPPRDAKQATLWLQPGARLGSKPPTQQSSDEYRSDPAHPVPYSERHALDRGEYMNADQRFATRRPDVLSYTSAEITEDVVLAGPLEADLRVSITGTDADFVVKLIDVYPTTATNPEPNPREVRMAGYEQLVRAEVMRGKFRDSLSTPTPFVPGQPTRVRFSLPDVSHAFRPGHRILVQIQSTWFPLVDLNPQRFVDIYHAKESDFRAETHTVHLGGPGTGSSIHVSLLRGHLP